MSKIPIKTTEEIEAMRIGGKVLQKILDSVEKKIQPGVTTDELTQLADEILEEEGMQPSFKHYGSSQKNPGFPATLCISVNDEVVHGIPSSRELVSGDIVGVDCGVFYKDLHTDAAKTFLVGEVSEDVKHFVKTTQKSLSRCLNKVRAGVHLGDISETIQKTIEQQGYAVVRSCTGHGVGRELHELPEILNFGKKGKGVILKSGMTLAIEPISVMSTNGGTYDADDGWTIKTTTGELSAHFEHTILVTDNGYEILA